MNNWDIAVVLQCSQQPVGGVVLGTVITNNFLIFAATYVFSTPLTIQLRWILTSLKQESKNKRNENTLLH